MYPIPQMAPISDLKHRHAEVFKRLKEGPVLLASRSQPAAVLVSPERWNAIVAYIDDLECGIEALQTELAVAKGEDDFERLTPAEVEEWLGDEDLSD
ncbi:MAG: type II toxin-antitoxin system Phd/YefM family antitoxin [Chloroflexi bacterium]|nr:type II toxin-antitoxin system Phd/YefM family antitoxin [Chloroflexota bacterium]